MGQRAARAKTNPLLTMKKKEKENKEKKLFLNKEKLRLLLKPWQICRLNWRLEAQSAIPSAGKESGKESVDSAKQQSYGALNQVIKNQSEDTQSFKDVEEEIGRVGGEIQIFANRHFRNVISNNVISNNCSLFSHRLHPRALQRFGNRNREAHQQRNRPSCSNLFTAPFRNRNLGCKCLKCQLCPGTSSRTSIADVLYS